MKKVIFILALFLFCSPAFAVNYCNDANNKGCWLMESDATELDVGGNTDNVLTVSSGDTIPQSGDKKFGTYSRDFEKDEADYLYHADGLDTDINGADQTMSLCFWYKPESASSTNYFIGKWTAATSDRQFAFAAFGGTEKRMEFGISSNGSANVWATSPSNWTDNAWTHYCGVYDDSYVYLYINGSEADTTASTAGIANKSANFIVGTGNSGNGFVDGLIDDVGIFNRALTPAEVSDIYTNGLLGSSGTPPTGSTIRNATIGNMRKY